MKLLWVEFLSLNVQMMNFIQILFIREKNWENISSFMNRVKACFHSWHFIKGIFKICVCVSKSQHKCEKHLKEGSKGWKNCKQQRRYYINMWRIKKIDKHEVLCLYYLLALIHKHKIELKSALESSLSPTYLWMCNA
jgi:hypothetical protein